MIIIGLSGNSGSGKGTVCKSFLKHGILSIDADMVYRDLTSAYSPLVKRLTDKFGSQILNTDLSLNRHALAEIVFSDKSKELLNELNRITHSSIIEETKRRISELSKAGHKAVIFDAPLLFESGFNRECDVIISVIADRDTKIKRIMERDGIDYEKANARIDAQLPDEYLIANSDYVIENTGSVSDMDSLVKKIINNIL